MTVKELIHVSNLNIHYVYQDVRSGEEIQISALSRKEMVAFLDRKIHMLFPTTDGEPNKIIVALD